MNCETQKQKKMFIWTNHAHVIIVILSQPNGKDNLHIE